MTALNTTLRAVALTAEAFAPFGQVLCGSGAATERKPFAAQVFNDRPGARANLTYMRIAPEARPIRIAQLERHPHSNQCFVPLAGTRQLVVVCPSDERGAPRLAGLQAFVAGAAQAVNYDAGVWHAPRMALNAPGEFVMLRWDDGGERDTELIALEAAVEVELPTT